MTDTQNPPGSFGPEQEQIPITATPENKDYYQNGYGNTIPTSYWDSIKATFQRAADARLTQRAFDNADLNNIDEFSGRKLSPNELNARYPDVEEPFTEDTSLPVADEIARRARERQLLDSIVSKGPQGGIYGASRTLLGLGVGLSDPGSLILSIAGGEALALSGVMGAEATTLAGRLGQSFVHGVAGTAIPEALAGYAALKDQQSYTLGDYASNLAVSGALYSGAATGFHYLKDYLSRRPLTERMSHESAIAQLMMDRQVDVNPIAQDIHGMTDGSVRPKAGQVSNVGEYRYEPIANSDDLRTREFYYGSDRSMGDFKSSEKVPLEDNFGKGVYLTDNPMVANGHAAMTFTDANGKIFKVAVDHPEVNTVNLDKPLGHGPVRDVIESYLDEQKNRKSGELEDGAEKALTMRGKTPLPPGMFEGSTGKEVLERIQAMMNHGSLPENALEEIGARLKAAGIDGFTYQGGDFAGKENAPHNIVMLFDPKETGDAGGLAKETGQYAPDRSMVATPSQHDLQERLKEKSDPSNSINFDPQAEQKMQELAKSPPEEMDIPKLQEAKEELLQTLKDLEAQGSLSDEHAKVLEKLREMEKDAGLEEKAIKAGMSCMGQDI